MKILKNIIVYILAIISYFYLFVLASLLGIINIYSKVLFIIVYFVIPILVLLLPITIKYIFKKKDFNITIAIFKGMVIHFIIIISLSYGITEYMGYFTIKKWSNLELVELRYLMIDDLEDKYKLIGMTKEEVIDILGKPDYEDEKSICYDARLHKDIVYDTYCLEYGDGLIIDTYKSWEERKKTMIKVKKLEERPVNSSVSYIADVLEYDGNNHAEQFKVFGKLKTLFGEPNYLSINNEDWFGYFLECNGKYFEVYGVNDIAHIGGDYSEESLALAKQLADYILKADTSDYEWTSYYMDSETKITYMVKDGVPSRVMEQLHLTDKEFSDLYAKVYNLD